jgi:hypothetical protein
MTPTTAERLLHEFESAFRDCLAVERFNSHEDLVQKARAAYAARRRELLELLTR